VPALRRAPGARSLSAVFAGLFAGMSIWQRLFGRPKAPVAPDPEDERFYSLFRGIKLRMLPGPPAIPLPGHQGPFVSVGISPDPKEALDQLSFAPRDEVCPVCGRVTEADARVACSLEPNSGRGSWGLVPVWAHHECLASCPVTDRQRGIPW